MHVIYLAGGIASGKSTVARVMRELGAEVIDLDELSREALAPGSRILPQIVSEFGEDIINPAGSVKRELLAQRAFSSTERAVTLEEIELPLIDETAAKIHELTPYEAQTGPAVRFDENVIQKHLDLLDDPRKKDLYLRLSQSIHQDYTQP